MSEALADLPHQLEVVNDAPECSDAVFEWLQLAAAVVPSQIPASAAERLKKLYQGPDAQVPFNLSQALQDARTLVTDLLEGQKISTELGTVARYYLAGHTLKRIDMLANLLKISEQTVKALPRTLRTKVKSEQLRIKKQDLLDKRPATILKWPVASTVQVEDETTAGAIQGNVIMVESVSDAADGLGDSDGPTKDGVEPSETVTGLIAMPLDFVAPIQEPSTQPTFTMAAATEGTSLSNELRPVFDTMPHKIVDLAEPPEDHAKSQKSPFPNEQPVKSVMHHKGTPFPQRRDERRRREGFMSPEDIAEKYKEIGVTSRNVRSIIKDLCECDDIGVMKPIEMARANGQRANHLGPEAVKLVETEILRLYGDRI
jgi:hypothetical protein